MLRQAAERLTCLALAGGRARQVTGQARRAAVSLVFTRHTFLPPSHTESDLDVTGAEGDTLPYSRPPIYRLLTNSYGPKTTNNQPL